jgi:hypothetical protein
MRFPLHLQNANDGEIRRQLFGAIDDVKKKVRKTIKLQSRNTMTTRYSFYCHYA